jgi:hypothetical protein
VGERTTTIVVALVALAIVLACVVWAIAVN